MKNIHFVNFNRRHYFVVVSFIMFLLALYFILRATKYETYFYTICNFISVVVIARTSFWHKAHVQYCAWRIFIRVNRKSGISLNYENITRVEHTATELIIKENKNIHHLAIEDINPKDVQRLIRILMEHSEAYYRDETELAYYN